MQDMLLEMTGICKSFPGVKALENVDFLVQKGEVHCLMGENGAGKSTLIKILAGAFTKDSGQIKFEDKFVDIKNTSDPFELGISFIHQELSVVDTLTVEENMTLGFEHSSLGVVKREKNKEKVVKILQEMSIELDPKEKVANLSVSKKQMMLIAKALSLNSKLIIMDEPTASLTDVESKQLFEMIKKLKKDNVTFVYISHRFEDIFAIGDRITVLRDGKNAAVLEVKDTSEDEIIRHMVGRNIEDTFPKIVKNIGDEILRVEDLTAEKLIKDITFTLHKGQILGVSGLAGAGKTELAQALFGVNKIKLGKIYLHNEEVKFKQPRDAIEHGIALLPEERRSEGIVGVLSVRENISLSSGNSISKFCIVNRKKDNETADSYIQKIRVKTPSREQKIRLLSGGNQQKALIGKWLNTRPDVLLLDEPTRGIDIGAKSEIYDLINQLAKSGKAIIMLSSEMPELIGVCDNIMVLNNGEITGIISREEFSQEKIMQLAIK